MNLFFWILLSFANPRNMTQVRKYPTKISALIKAFQGDDKKMQLYSSRELLRQVKQYQKQYNRSDTGSLEYLESKQKLFDFNRLVAPVCTQKIKELTYVKRCASLLGRLQYVKALPDLRIALQKQHSFCTRRTLKKVISILEKQ